MDLLGAIATTRVVSRSRRSQIGGAIALRVSGSAVVASIVHVAVAAAPTSDESLVDLVIGFGIAIAFLVMGALPWVMLELLVLRIGEPHRARWLPKLVALTVGAGVASSLLPSDPAADLALGYHLVWGWVVVVAFSFFADDSVRDLGPTRLRTRMSMW